MAKFLYKNNLRDRRQNLETFQQIQIWFPHSRYLDTHDNLVLFYHGKSLFYFDEARKVIKIKGGEWNKKIYNYIKMHS